MVEAFTEREKTLNYRAGLAAAAIYNVHTRKKKSDPVMEPLSFFPTEEKPIEMDVTKLAHGVEYMLRMCEATFSAAKG